MCDIATASLVVGLVGTGMGAIGQYQQGQAAKAQSEYQAKVAQNNQIIAERNAVMAEERGKVSELQKRRETQQLIGRQRAGIAASGLQVDVGSAANIVEDTAMLGEYDVENIRYQTAMDAYNYRVSGAQYGQQAALSLAQGQSAYQAGIVGAGSTLLQGGASFGEKWTKYKKGS
jgi:hypothetical protein